MNNLEKGKKIFFTMAIVLLGISLVSSIISSFTNGVTELFSGVVRTGLEGLLLYYIYKGKNWAKYIMITLFTIVIVLLVYIVIIFSFDLMSIIAILVYVGSIYVMGFSPSVKEYLKSVN